MCFKMIELLMIVIMFPPEAKITFFVYFKIVLVLFNLLSVKSIIFAVSNYFIQM